MSEYDPKRYDSTPENFERQKQEHFDNLARAQAEIRAERAPDLAEAAQAYLQGSRAALLALIRRKARRKDPQVAHRG